MQIQDLSYTLNNDKLDFKDYQISIEVFSLENVYTIEPQTLLKKGNHYHSDHLLWGNSESVLGNVDILVEEKEDHRAFQMEAQLEQNIRSIKLRFDHLPLGKYMSSTDEEKEVTEHGLLFKYPEGWRSLSTPLLVFELKNGQYLYISVKDKQIRQKIFYMKKVEDMMRLDVVMECDGTEISTHFKTPIVECGIKNSLDEIILEHSNFIKSAYGLEEYVECSIAPSWLKDIALVVTMHMETFTGFIFHTYEQALEDMKKITTYLDGKNILVYLAGWEGRYYYKYGNYTPDERMGGAKKLKELVDGLHALGCKVMAMYGMNMVNRNIPALKDIVPVAEFQSVSGAKYHCGSVDWEGAHHYDFNELSQLNVGCKVYQDYLFNQIKNATDEFDFDGAFLDIAACFTNDKNYKLYDGVVELCDRLRTIKKDFLVSGEGYYDGLAKAMPLFQSGHTDGWLHYHDRFSPLLFTRFAREFAHLCLGDVGRGSSGVHELGTNTETMTPLREGIIPTLSLVENTIPDYFEKVKVILDQAKEYKRRFL